MEVPLLSTVPQAGLACPWQVARAPGPGVWDGLRTEAWCPELAWSWPGTPWGGKKTQLGPRPPAGVL